MTMTGRDIATALTEIEEAMWSLENMPCGGIGDGGATVEEMRAANEERKPIDDDAMYHAEQWAWRRLQNARKALKE